jgi:hypothetical protein
LPPSNSRKPLTFRERTNYSRGVAACALDPEAAARLWQVSPDMLAS